MGGTNEQVLNPPAPPVMAGVPLKASAIRIHQNAGEVHLHDDTNKRKFACAVSDFFTAWNKGKSTNFSPPLEVLGHDGKNSPLVAKFEKVVKGNEMDVAISFESVKLGDTINKIDKFVQGG